MGCMCSLYIKFKFQEHWTSTLPFSSWTSVSTHLSTGSWISTLYVGCTSDLNWTVMVSLYCLGASEWTWIKEMAIKWNSALVFYLGGRGGHVFVKKQLRISFPQPRTLLLFYIEQILFSTVNVLRFISGTGRWEENLHSSLHLFSMLWRSRKKRKSRSLERCVEEWEPEDSRHLADNPQCFDIVLGCSPCAADRQRVARSDLGSGPRRDAHPFHSTKRGRFSFWSRWGQFCLGDPAVSPCLLSYAGFADNFYLSKLYLDNNIFHSGLLQCLDQGQFYILVKS